MLPSTPPWPSNAPLALLAFTLMDHYHRVVVPSLKALRANQQGETQVASMRARGEHMHEQAAFVELTEVLRPAEQEQHRLRATGFFNHLYRLFQAQLIDPDLFVLVLEPAAARLWLDHVAPLDRAIRRAAGGGDEEHPVETFYRRYADTRQLLLRVVKTETARAAEPAGAH